MAARWTLLTVLFGFATADIFSAIQKVKTATDTEALGKILKADPGALDRTGPGGQTPLMHSVLQGKTEAVRFFLRKHADVTIGEKDGYTPMHGAGFQGRADIAKLLIQHGVPPFGVHADGHTPMQRACWGKEQRHADTLAIFIEAGATARDMELCKEAAGPRGLHVLAEFWDNFIKKEEL